MPGLFEMAELSIVMIVLMEFVTTAIRFAFPVIVTVLPEMMLGK